jgi:hypothetical protein
VREVDVGGGGFCFTLAWYNAQCCRSLLLCRAQLPCLVCIPVCNYSADSPIFPTGTWFDVKKFGIDGLMALHILVGCDALPGGVAGVGEKRGRQVMEYVVEHNTERARVGMVACSGSVVWWWRGWCFAGWD